MTTNYNGIIFDDEQPSGGIYSGIIFDDDPVASRIPKESVSTLKSLGILNEEGDVAPLSDEAREEMNYNIYESEKRTATKWAGDNNKDGVFGSMSSEERDITPDLVARGLESIEYRAKGDIDSARARALSSLQERLANEEDFDPMSVDGVMYEMEKDYKDMSPAAREFLIREAVLKDVGGDLEKYEKEFLPSLTPEQRNEEAIRVRNIVAWGNQSKEEQLSSGEMGPLEKVQNDLQAKYGVKASKGYSAAVASTPFADTAIAVADMFITEDLEKLMKGDFNLDEVLNSGKFDSIKEAYDSGEYSRTKARNMIKLVAYESLRSKAENQGEAIAERERRGVSTWGHVGAGGMEVFALGGEFLSPFGPAGKGATVGTKVATVAAQSAAPLASSAARRYANLRTNDYSFDENGNLYVSAEADSVGDAIVKSAVGAVAEVTIEKVGGEFLGKVFGATVGKAASSKVGQAVANYGVVRGVGKVVNFAKTPLKALGWNGLPGEMGEEFLQGATDAFLGLDTTESRKEGTTAAGRFKKFAGDFFKGENLVELAESMLLMQAVGGGSAYLQQRYSSKQLDKIITTRIGGVSENVLKKLSPEEKARIIEAHYSGLSADEAAAIINKGAGALDKFMIEKQTEATKSAKGRAMLAEMNPEAADAIRAARREGRDISRKMIRDLGLSEKVLGDVESRNKFGDALLEDRRKLAAKNAAKMDGQHEMALRQEIGRLTQDTSEAQRVYDRVVMKIKDASVLDDPYQREQLVMQAAEAVYAEDQARRVGGARQRARMSERADYEARLAEAEARATEQAQRAVNDAQERINAEMMARETKRYNDFMLAREEARAKGGVNETRANETQQKTEQAQPVTPPAGEEARPVEAGKAPTKVGREIEASKTASKTPIGAPIETKVSLLPTTAESATGGSKAADAASTPTKPKTVKEGKAFVNSNIGKRYTDGKKTYEITGLTKDGEVSVKVTDKIGKSSETTLKLSSTLNNIFGTKKTSAVWSEVKNADSAKKSPSRRKTTGDDVARLADETVPTYLKAIESSHSGGNIGEDYKIESNFANEVLKMVKGMSESELGEVSTSLRKTFYAKGNPMPGGYKPLLDAASYALDAAREGKDSVRLPMPEHLRTRVKTTAKTSKMEQKVPKAEVADEKTATPPKEKEKPNEPEDKSEEEVSVKEPSNLLNIVNFDPKQESHVKDLIRTIPNVLKRSLKDYSEYDSKLREFVERFNEQLQKFGYLAEVPKLKVPANPDAYILLGDFGQTVEMVESPALFKIYGSEKSLLQKGKVHTSTDDQSLYSGNSVMAERSLLQELITNDAKTMTLDTWLKKWSPVKELIRVNEDRYNKDREKSLAPLYYSALLGSVEKASILKKYGISDGNAQTKGKGAEKEVMPPKNADKKTAQVAGKAEVKRNESGRKTEVKKPTKPIKANPKKAAGVVKEFVSKDEKRSYANRIHHDHDSGLAVATNGSILIATKHGYDPNYKDDNRNPYPNWRQVVPTFKKGEGQTITIDPNAVLEATKIVKKLASGIKSDNMIRIKLPNGEHTYMSVNTLSRVAKAMAANGITDITTEGAFKPLLAKNNDTTIVAMPLRNGDGDVKLGRNAETKIVTFDLESGKVISAPESKIDKMRRGFAEKLRADIAEGRTKEIEWLRTTELYKGLIAAQKKGETDAKKVYEGIAREEGSWGKLSEANKKLFAELLATKDTAELENRFSEYSAKMKDSKKQSPQNDWVERTPKELAKLEKEIAAEDAIDAMMADAEPKPAPKSEPKAGTKAESKKETKVEPKSEAAPTITPAEAMKKLGSLGAADVDMLTKAMHREERLGHTERANMIRVLRDYKRGVGTNSNPQSDETSGGKYRASVEAAKPLDDPAFLAWAKKRGVAPTTQKRNEYDKAMADTLTNRLSRWIKGVSVKWVNFIAPEEGGDVRPIHDGERIVGSYNRATGEVKLAKGASVETVLHELGWHAARHWAEVNADSDPKAANLLKQMKEYAESAPKEIKDAVRDTYGEMSADTLLDEIGAARFTKEQSGKIAEALATKEGAAWYQKVWNKVVDFFKNFLTKIGYNRVDLDGVENISPDVFGDFLADVMMSGKQLGERTAFSMEAPKGLAAKWTNNLSDYKAPIAELEKRTTGSSNNIYYLARTLEGMAQRGKNRAERAIKRVEKILGEDISPELLAQYMQLKAYEERNAKIERRNGKADASGMTPEDARAIEKTIKDSGVDEAIFEEAAQILWDLQKEGLQARVDAGLLDQETANKWMTDEPHHIPWKDAVDPDSGEYVGRKVGASEFDTAEGRKTAASGDPITWMLQEYQDAMTRAAQNRLRSSIANLTRLNGDVGTIYDGIQTDSKGKRSFIKYPKNGGKAKVLSIPEGVKIESTVKNDGGMKNVLTFKEGGETKYLVLNGTLGEAVAGAVTGRTLARPPALISLGTRAYAATATALSPTFALRNLTADNFDIHNYLVSKHGFLKGEKMFAKVLAEQGKMFWPLMRYVYTGDFKFGKNGEMSKFQKLVEAYEDAGGLIGGMATEGYDATVKKVQAKFRAGKNKARAVGEGVIKSWLTLQRMSEFGPRLAIFKAGVDSGMSAKDAVMMAREATVDFNKKGQKTPWFNTLWMFSNSALGSNLMQLKNINSRAGITLLGGWCLYGFAEGLVDAMLGGDDDELDEEGLATGEDISEYTRKNSLYIRNGSTVYRANIHMGPFAYAKYFGNCMARVAAGKMDGGKAAKELTKSGVEIGTTLTGLGNVNAEAFFQTAVPTLLQTPTQIATGVDYAGREMYRKKYTEEHPDSSYGRSSTPQVYHNVAKWLNRVTGGNEARKGWIDVRPETLQALTEMVGKNFARDVVEISETGYKVATGDTENLDIRNVPFAGDFVRTHESNANRFYEAYNMYRADKYELKNNPELKGEARRKFLKERPWLYSAGKPGVTRIDNIVKRIEKLRDVEESDRATDERKAEAKAMRRKLQARVIKIMEGK